MGMMNSCPDPGIWVSWVQGTLPEADRQVLEAHLSTCPACQGEMASLASAIPQSPDAPRQEAWRALLRKRQAPFWRPLSAAAAVLLVAAGWLVWGPSRQPDGPSSISHGPLAAPADLPAPCVASTGGPGLRQASGRLDILLGRSAEVSLEAGARGRVLPSGPGFELQCGTARAEAVDTALRLTVPGQAGELELLGGSLVLEVAEASRVQASAFFLSEAFAGEPSCRFLLERGKAFWVRDGERHPVEAGTGFRWGADGPSPDPWRPFSGTGWRSLAGMPLQLRDGVHPLPGPPRDGAFVAEFLVRKRVPAAEADLLFTAGGKSWRLPLGAQLPAGEGWVRLRLEQGGSRVRFLAAGAEIFSAQGAQLETFLHPVPTGEALALRAWGGDVEIGEVRWRE